MCQPHEDLKKDNFLKIVSSTHKVTKVEAEKLLNEFLEIYELEYEQKGFDWCETVAKELPLLINEAKD